MPEPRVRFEFAGRTVEAAPGQTFGSALWAAGVREFRRTRRAGRPRSLYCGIGQCFDCLISLDGGAPVRACVTPAVDGAVVAGAPDG